MIELRLLDGERGYFRLRLHSAADAMRLLVGLRHLSLGISFNAMSDNCIIVRHGAYFTEQIEKIGVALGICRMRFFVPKK